MQSNYPSSTLGLLLGTHSILDNIGLYIDRFTASNSTLTEKWRTDFLTRLGTIEKTLGVDSFLDKKQSEQTIVQTGEQLIVKAIRLKDDMEFPYTNNISRYNLLTSSLGLDNIKSTKSRSKLYSTSMSYEENIGGFRTELTGLGVNATLIDDVLALATKFKDDYKALESNHNRAISTTDEQQTELNSIYTDIMAVCKLGQSIFSKEPNISKLFTFSQVKKKYVTPRKSKKVTPPPAGLTPPPTNTPTDTTPTTDKPVEPPVSH